ncbi:PKD domain-containing protein [Spirosoma validum]|uniref:PKD domain-containing protein n=1 Tax=Spirosoma validum TaxID=2771355 RepID=A0A927B9E8_9BACT|nr:PKD domain-containing protein [Spirosoma validum]MBD2757693.1 PKD domain-containing protein [Spirosoma validum]
MNYLKRFTLLVCLLGLLVDCKNGAPVDGIQPPTVPTASFTVTNDGCIAPCAPTFTSTSPNATSYVWEIDGSRVSTDATFTRQFTTAGTYTVKFTAANSVGINSSQKTITINKPATPVVNKVWDKTFGGKDNDGPRSMVATSDGGFLVGGSSSSGQDGNKSDPKRGQNDMWVVKIDGNGNKLWDKTFGGTGSDALSTILATSDGGFLLGGNSDSGQEGNKSALNKGDSDMWLVKIDGSGNKLWDKTFGGRNSDYLSAMVATSDGGFLLGGDSFSDQIFDKSDPNRGRFDYWVVKIDMSGTKLWDKTFGGSANESLYSMVATSDGGFLLGGDSSSGQDGNKSDPNRGGGGSDMWLVKIDRNGTKLWDKTFGGSADDYLYTMVATSDGGVLLGGLSKSGQDGNKSDPNRGQGDMWLVKIDGNGTKLWDKTFGGSSSDELRSLVATSDGGFLLGGTSGPTQDGNKSDLYRGASDYWLVRIDGGGNKLWDKTFGGGSNDIMYSLLVTSDGGFSLAGTSRSDQDGDKFDPYRGGDYDYWVVKVK